MIDMALSPDTRSTRARHRHSGGHAPGAALRILLIVATATLGMRPGSAGEDLLRVTCHGQFQLSVTEPALECAESDLFTDPEGGLMSVFSAARAELAGARLGAGAAGGAIREVGYRGREASTLLLQGLRIVGDWQGEMPLAATLELRYGFGGHGEGRMRAALRISLDDTIRREHHAGFRMRHTEFGGALLADEGSHGDHSLPRPGRYPSRSRLTLNVAQKVPSERPNVVVRADLNVLAAPSLGSLEASASALVRVEARLLLSAPCPVSAHSRNGALPVAVSEETAASPGPDPAWRCGPARRQAAPSGS